MRVVVWTVFTGVVMIVGAMITLVGVRLGVFMRVRVDMGMGVRMGVRAAPGVFMFVLMDMLVFMGVIVFRLLIAGHRWFLTVVRPLGTGCGVKLQDRSLDGFVLRTLYPGDQCGRRARRRSRVVRTAAEPQGNGQGQQGGRSQVRGAQAFRIREGC